MQSIPFNNKLHKRQYGNSKPHFLSFKSPDCVPVPIKKTLTGGKVTF